MQLFLLEGNIWLAKVLLHSLSCRWTSAAVLSVVSAQTFSSSTDWTSSSFSRSSLIRWESRCLGTPDKHKPLMWWTEQEVRTVKDLRALTLQHDDQRVSHDAEGGDENQDGEDVGADGISQLQVRLWRHQSIHQSSVNQVDVGGAREHSHSPTESEKEQSLEIKVEVKKHREQWTRPQLSKM